MTTNEREVATINYFRVVDSVDPCSGKSVKVPRNWLPHQILFDCGCFLGATGLCSAIPRGNLIAAYAFDLAFFAFTPLILFCCMQMRLSTFSWPWKGSLPRRKGGIWMMPEGISKWRSMPCSKLKSFLWYVPPFVHISQACPNAFPPLRLFCLPPWHSLRLGIAGEDWPPRSYSDSHAPCSC